jgi:hypothetical protein
VYRLDLGQGSTSFSFLNRSGRIVELGRFPIEKDTIVISDDGDGCCALTDYACAIPDPPDAGGDIEDGGGRRPAIEVDLHHVRPQLEGIRANSTAGTDRINVWARGDVLVDVGCGGTRKIGEDRPVPKDPDPVITRRVEPVEAVLSILERRAGEIGGVLSQEGGGREDRQEDSRRDEGQTKG